MFGPSPKLFWKVMHFHQSSEVEKPNLSKLTKIPKNANHSILHVQCTKSIHHHCRSAGSEPVIQIDARDLISRDLISLDLLSRDMIFRDLFCRGWF
jgi:hypothetical protein